MFQRFGALMGKKYDPDKVEDILGLDRAWRRKRGLWIVLISLFVLLLSIGAWNRYISDRNHGRIHYKTQEARRGDLTVTVTATGTLFALNQVDVGIEVSGTIEHIYVDYNDHVHVDQVLARLDTSKLDAQVLQARAQLESAKAAVLKAKAEMKQAKSKMEDMKQAWELTKGKVPSQVEMDIAEATLMAALSGVAMADAEVSKADASLKFYETELSKAVIRSPINGIVLAKHVEVGQTIAATFQTPVLFTLAEDLKEMELHVDVDEADVGQVRAGQEATFAVDAYPDSRFPAKVMEVRFFPKTVEGVVTYETLLSVDNSDLSLRPGMTATADIVVKRVKDALLIPNAALRFTPLKPQKVIKEKRGLLGAFLPHRPRRAPPEKGEEIPLKRGERLVWILRDRKPVSIPIRLGGTDGKVTEVVAGDIKPGMSLLIEMVISGK
jgi:HlyD family secretion protein